MRIITSFSFTHKIIILLRDKCPYGITISYLEGSRCDSACLKLVINVGNKFSEILKILNVSIAIFLKCYSIEPVCFTKDVLC